MYHERVILCAWRILIFIALRAGLQVRNQNKSRSIREFLSFVVWGPVIRQGPTIGGDTGCGKPARALQYSHCLITQNTDPTPRPHSTRLFKPFEAPLRQHFTEP